MEAWATSLEGVIVGNERAINSSFATLGTEHVGEEKGEQAEGRRQTAISDSEAQEKDSAPMRFRPLSAIKVTAYQDHDSNLASFITLIFVACGRKFDTYLVTTCIMIS